MKGNNTLKEIVYHKILNGILSDEYKPNQIITERELVEKFGYSKSPVREALLTLCNENVLLSHPRYGYEVVRITSDDVNNILEYRYILEGSLLRKYHEAVGEEQIQELRLLDKVCVATLEKDMWTHWEANTRFHLALASYSKNAYAVKQLSSAMTALKRAYAQFYWQKWTTVNPNDDVRFHEDLIQCLEKGELDRALSCLRNDLNDFGI